MANSNWWRPRTGFLASLARIIGLPSFFGRFGRRSGSEIIRELHLRRRAQLHRILQPGAGTGIRAAIKRDRPRQAEAAGVQIAGRGGAADHRPYAPRHLLAAAGSRT